MSVVRRNFLKAGIMAAVAAGFLTRSPLTALAQDSKSTGYFPVPFEAKTENTFYFKQSTFEPYVNTDFKVQASRITATLRLIAVEQCGDTETKATGECFALTFKADRQLSIVQTIHPFTHDALGEFDLFVSTTKVKSDPDGLYYVAVINHQIQTSRPTFQPRSKPQLKRAP